MKVNFWSFLGFTLLSVALLFTSCSDYQNKEKAPSQDATSTILSSALTINPPFEGIEIPFLSNLVDGEKGGEIRLENNGVIIVPENTFVDEAGNAIVGDVTLKYREFHSIEEVIISGIPMTYRSGDEIENFVTAGMFEIKGEAKGKEAFIAPGKQIQVNMASFTTQPGVKFFALDAKTNQWEYVTESKVQPLTKKAESKKEKVLEKPLLPNKVDQEAFKFDIAVEYAKFPELKKHKGVIWQYVSKAGYDNPEQDPNFYNEKWTWIDLQSFDANKKQYELILTSKTRTFRSIVTPVLGEKNFKKARAQYEKEMKKYLANVATVTALNQQQAEITRQMGISQFGIYNHDYFYQASNPVVANLQLKIKGNDSLQTNLLSVFLVMKSKNAVIKYTNDGYDKFSAFTFDKEENNALVVILPKKKIAVFSPEQFRKATAKGKQCVFEIDNTTSIANLKDMSDVIKAL
jgi:hypothetical protein